MPGKNACGYEGCNNTKRKKPDLTFHRFPQNDRIRKDWIERCGNDHLKNLDAKQIDNVRICSDHFLEQNFVQDRNGKRMIQSGALPIDARTGGIPQPDNDVSPNNVLGISAFGNSTTTTTTTLTLPTSSRKSFHPDNANLVISAVTYTTPVNQEPTYTLANTAYPRTACTKPPSSSNLRTAPLNPVKLGPVSRQVKFASANPAIQSTHGTTTSANTAIGDEASLTVHLTVKNSRAPKTVTSSQPSVPSRKKSLKVKTPKEQQLQRLVTSLRAQIKLKDQKIKRLEAASEKVAHYIEFAKAAFDLNASQLAFFNMQLNHRKKHTWEEDEKQFALSLYYRSPKAYSYLKDAQHFALPCVTLIQRWINKLNIAPGVNQTVLDRLTLKTSTMTDHERQCVLMWDEMSIKKILEYNSKADLVEGFQDLGELGRTNECANYALVFMLRGLMFPWKQPFAYFVSHGNVCNPHLAKLIKNVLDAIVTTGLVVRFMVCDQGSNNRTAVTSLGVTEQKPYIELDGRKIFFGYDVPHLVKSIRNNLLTKDIIIDGNRATWNAIRELRNVERDRMCKAAPKLTDRHVEPNNFQRMKVSLATQVFSHSVAAALETGALTGDLKHPDCISTASFVKYMNDEFDCLNSRSPVDPNPLRRALSSKQPQVEEFLQNSLLWLQKWTVSIGNSPPCFEGLRLTVRSVLQLWDEMRNAGACFLITTRLNQDPIENLFAVIRSRGGHNDNPSAMTFRRNLQYAMIANLIKPVAETNCEADDASALLAVKLNAKKQKSSADETANVNENISIWLGEEPIIEETVDQNQDDGVLENRTIKVDSLEECSMKYVAGYLVHKCLLQFDCSECETSLSRGDQMYQKTDDFLIFFKAFKTQDNAELGNLRVPSDDFHQVVLTAYRVFNAHFTTQIHRKNISKYLEKCVTTGVFNRHLDFWSIDGQCTEHREYIIKFFVRVHLFNYLKWKSRDMRDQSNAKRSRSSASLKPHRKLLKVTHQ